MAMRLGGAAEQAGFSCATVRWEGGARPGVCRPCVVCTVRGWRASGTLRTGGAGQRSHGWGLEGQQGGGQ